MPLYSQKGRGVKAVGLGLPSLQESKVQILFKEFLKDIDWNEYFTCWLYNFYNFGLAGFDIPTSNWLHGASKKKILGVIHKWSFYKPITTKRGGCLKRACSGTSDSDIGIVHLISW